MRKTEAQQIEVSLWYGSRKSFLSAMKKKSSANDLWDMIWRRQIFTACHQFDESKCLSQIFHLPMHGRRWITIWRAYYSVRFPNLEHLCNSTANSQTVCFTFCLEFLSLSISISDRFCYGLGRVFSFSAEDYIKKRGKPLLSHADIAYCALQYRE